MNAGKANQPEVADEGGAHGIHIATRFGLLPRNRFELGFGKLNEKTIPGFRIRQIMGCQRQSMREGYLSLLLHAKAQTSL